mmetsp:Transcript_49323/g.78575  ORF Transcript_49323/g.78575 Transcript_49323/m.78575 type:complete len:423 (-) Transcript_49323:2004-3272(-)
MRTSVRGLARDDYLAVRLKRLLAWTRSCSVAELPEDGAHLCTLILPELCASRHLGASELQSLVTACRGHCRALSRPDVLESILEAVDEGMREMRGLSQAASNRLVWLEECTFNVRENLRFLTSASLNPLRTQMRAGELAGQTTMAHALLQPTAVLVGETDCVPDAFAARCLLSEGVAFLARAASLKPEKVAPLRRRRFRKAFAKHKDQIKAAVSAEPEVFQQLGRWLGIMDAWYEQMPVLMDLCLLRDALAQHLLPLACWGLRPHRRPILGRVMPPPDPPDAVLRDPEVQEQLMRYFAAAPASPAPASPVSAGYPADATEPRGETIQAPGAVMQVAPPVPVAPAAPAAPAATAAGAAAGAAGAAAAFTGLAAVFITWLPVGFCKVLTSLFTETAWPFCTSRVVPSDRRTSGIPSRFKSSPLM